MSTNTPTLVFGNNNEAVKLESDDNMGETEFQEHHQQNQTINSSHLSVKKPAVKMIDQLYVNYSSENEIMSGCLDWSKKFTSCFR